MSSFTISIWFVAIALVWACADLLQVRSAAGIQPFPALAAMVLVVYAGLGAATGLIAAWIAARRSRDRRRASAVLVAGAFAAFGAVFVGGYLNVLYLPAVAEPLTIAANAAILLVALATWRLLARSARLEALAHSRAAALALATAAITGGLLIAGGSQAPQPRRFEPAAGASPNVFVIVIDSLRYDRMWTGMPNLARLAGESAVFDRAYAQSSWTKPSVASLFTSLYPATHQANLRRGSLSSALPTMPERFAAAGYRTAVFSANPWIAPAFGFDRGVDRFFEADRETFSRFVIVLRALKSADRLLPARPVAAAIGRLHAAFGLKSSARSNCERDRLIVEELGLWLRADSRPAFAYLHLMSPHIPYEPPAQPAGREIEFAAAEQVALLQSTEALPPARASDLLELYHRTVAHADQMLGEILALLEARGIHRESIVVITADHGEEFHDHGHWGHGKSLYDELVRVPLVMRGPGIAQARIEEPAMLIDLLPTLARLAGLAPDESWEGEDLQSISPARPAFAELIREGGFESAMAYRDRRKVIETVQGLGSARRVEIYDVSQDPRELVDLSGSGPQVDSIVELLQRHRGEVASRRVRAPAAAIDPATDERLKALGYLD